MRFPVSVAILGCLIVTIATGQQPNFDVASVRVVNPESHPAFGNSGGPGTSDPGRIHLCCVGMFSLLMRAYDVKIDQILGPSWIMDNTGPNLYQIDALMPASTTRAQFRLMMQNLLRERFHLRIHRQKRNFPGYELLIAQGGPKLKESRPDPNAAVPGTSPMPKRSDDGSLVLPPGPQMFISLGRGTIIVQAQEKPVSELVKNLGRLIAQSLGENPGDFASPKPRIIDKTGLTGENDFTLRFSCEGCQFAMINGALGALPGPADSSDRVPDIFAALKTQLGLRLVKIKDIPLDVIVVDRVDKAPTAN